MLRKLHLLWRLCALGLVMLCILTALPACARSKPPRLEDIYDEAVELIEASFEVNDIVFGYGLPTYAYGSEYAEMLRIYDKAPQFENVTEYATVATLESIKIRMSAVYSAAYVESLFTPLFDGYAYEEGSMPAQYREDSSRLYQWKNYQPLVTRQRIYDYASMRVVSGDEKTAVIEIDSHLENEQTTLVVELVLVLENGEWRLDTPTY
jgi:hypothetical protein